MRFVVRVSRKGQIVIPADIRKRYRIGRRVVVEAGEKGIRIIPLASLEELFGADGEVMREIAREIVRERREEAQRD